MLLGLKVIFSSIILLLLIVGVNSIMIIYAIIKGGLVERSLIILIQIFVEVFEHFDFHRVMVLLVMFFLIIMVFIVVYIRNIVKQNLG